MNTVLQATPTFPPTAMETLLTAVDASDGQLYVVPRYSSQAAPNTRSMCPAATARVEEDQHQQPAILTKLHTIGDVALDNILIHDFPIDRAD